MRSIFSHKSKFTYFPQYGSTYILVICDCLKVCFRFYTNSLGSKYIASKRHKFLFEVGGSC